MEVRFSSSDHIPAGIGKAFTNLEILNIYGQSIEFVERRDFENMNQLTALVLAELKIDFLPDDLLTDLPNLESIRMSNSKIENIPEKMFANQAKLKSLSLGGNSITVLKKDLFRFNPNLEELNLNGNNLMKIFVDFTELGAIVTIHVEDNKCISRDYSKNKRNRIESLQNAVTSCCKASASDQPSDNPNCLCFPKHESCKKSKTTRVTRTTKVTRSS